MRDYCNKLCIDEEKSDDTHIKNSDFMCEESLTVTYFESEVLTSSLVRPKRHGVMTEMLN